MSRMEPVVLDASALLALLGSEAGQESVQAALPGAVINAVNLAEVVGRLADHGMPEQEIREALVGLGLDVRAFGEEEAWHAGMSRPVTRAAGLSLGDRACLATGASLALPVLTADRQWATLALQIEIRLIR